MPYRWEVGKINYLEGSEERPAKRRRGESSIRIFEQTYAEVPVTWRVDVDSVGINAIRKLVLEHPLLDHLARVNTGPPSPIPIEYPEDDSNGQWTFSEDVDVGCPPGKSDGVLRNAYSDVVDVFEEVGIPPNDSVAKLLKTVPEILRTRVGDRAEDLNLREESQRLRQEPPDNARIAPELERARTNLEENTRDVLRLSAELVTARATLRAFRNVLGELDSARYELVTAETELATTKTKLSTATTQLGSTKTQLDMETAQWETDGTLLDAKNTSLDRITHDRNCVLADYHGCVESLVIRDGDLSRVNLRRDSLCLSIGSAVDDVIDRQNVFVDRVSRAVFRALSHMSEPLEGLVEAATIGVLGLPDTTGAGESEMYEDPLNGNGAPPAAGPST